MLLLERLLAFTLAEGGIRIGNSSSWRVLALFVALGSVDIKLASSNLVHDLIVDVRLPFKVFVIERALEGISILLSGIELVVETSDAPRQIIELLLGIRDVLLTLLVIINNFVFQGFGEEAFKGIDVRFYSRHVLLVLTL